MQAQLNQHLWGTNFKTNLMKELNRFKKFLNENKMQTTFPEFVGEPNDAINDLANQFVITIEDELDAGKTTGTLEFMDYYTSDESDPTWIASSKWYYDIARYMKPKGDVVTITAGTESDTPALKLTFDEPTQNINWETLDKLNEQLTPDELRKEFYKGMKIMDSALAKAKGTIPQEQWNALYAVVTKVEDAAENIGE